MKIPIPPLPDLPEEEFRLCQDCLQVRPITDFRRRKRGGTLRTRKCRLCHNAKETLRIRRCRTKEDYRRVKQLMAQLRIERSLNRVLAMVDVMIQQFGGFEEFCVAWISFGQRVQGNKAAPKIASDFYLGMARLIETGTVLREKSLAVQAEATMSDEELGSEILSGIEQVIRKQPEVVLEAAEELGWAVTAPENSHAGA